MGGRLCTGTAAWRTTVAGAAIRTTEPVSVVVGAEMEAPAGAAADERITVVAGTVELGGAAYVTAGAAVVTVRGAPGVTY
mmetsp:Transcript_9353/g.23260  ORF Transcript_9353/g.23260 Transcript_9353/m.23260 type:complete len:80 (-) Transcript_9353:304-543(-)